MTDIEAIRKQYNADARYIAEQPEGTHIAWLRQHDNTGVLLALLSTQGAGADRSAVIADCVGMLKSMARRARENGGDLAALQIEACIRGIELLKAPAPTPQEQPIKAKILLEYCSDLMIYATSETAKKDPNAGRIYSVAKQLKESMSHTPQGAVTEEVYCRAVSEDMMNSPQFNAIWEVIKHWDIGVPSVYGGYCMGNGSHVAAIVNALRKPKGGE